MAEIAFIKVQVKLLQRARSSDILPGDSSNQHRAAVSFLTCAGNNRQQLKAMSERNTFRAVGNTLGSVKMN